MRSTLFRLCTLVTLLGLTAAVSQAAEKEVSVKKHIFKKTPQGELAMFVHLPPDWKPTDKRPAIVFFFGGGWRAGRITQFERQCDYLAKRGMVAARADYRVLSRHKVRPDTCVEDCKSAVRWLRKNASRLGIDSDRIAAGGGSAGGHTAAATAMVPGFEAAEEDKKISSKPNLLVLFNPAMDTTIVPEDRLGSKDLGKKISPNHQVTKDAPPAIILFGTDDRLLKYAQDYMKRAKELGLEAELCTAKGAKHGFFNRSPWQERTLYLVDGFLVKHGYLKGAATITVKGGPMMEKTSTR